MGDGHLYSPDGFPENQLGERKELVSKMDFFKRDVGYGGLLAYVWAVANAMYLSHRFNDYDYRFNFDLIAIHLDRSLTDLLSFLPNFFLEPSQLYLNAVSVASLYAGLVVRAYFRLHSMLDESDSTKSNRVIGFGISMFAIIFLSYTCVGIWFGLLLLLWPIARKSIDTWDNSDEFRNIVRFIGDFAFVEMLFIALAVFLVQLIFVIQT